MQKPKGSAPAGWYDAPEVEGALQYWNGKSWSKNKRFETVGLPDSYPAPVKTSFLDSIRHTLINTLNFKGRAAEREYWLFEAAYLGIVLLTSIIFSEAGNLKFIPAIFLWGLMPTQISLYVRRCHDSNRRGWWYFVPVGNLFVLFADSDDIDNRFGPAN